MSNNTKFSTTSIILILFSCTGATLLYNSGKYMNLVKLITDFRNIHRAFDIYLAQSGYFGDLVATTAYSKLFKLLSEQNVFLMITNITNIPRDVSHNIGKTNRLVFIVIITSTRDFQQFSRVTRTTSMNSYRTLLFFTENMEYCHAPTGNPLNLEFNSQVLVKCEGLGVLREWYSLRYNETKVIDYCQWRPDEKGIVPLTNMSFYQRRHSLEGISLRVTAVDDSRLENQPLTGFFGNLLMEIANVSNFKVNLQPYEKSPGSYNYRTKTWNGLIRKLQENETDIGIGEFIVTVERIKTVDFSNPILLSRSNLYVKVSDSYHLLWSMYYNAYGVKVSYCFLFILFLAPIVLTIILSRSNLSDFKAHYYDFFFQAWGIVCTQCSLEISDRSAARIACYSLYVLSFVSYSMYSALLVSYLTIFKPDMPFSSLQEFAESKTHKIAIIKNTTYPDLHTFAGFSNVHDTSSIIMDENEWPATLSAAFDQVCSENLRAVLLLNEIILKNTEIAITCQIIPFQRGSLGHMAFSFTKDSPYVGLFNYYLQKLHNNGLINQLKHKYLKKCEPHKKPYESLSLWNTLPIFLILTAGGVTSVLIMILENMVFYIRKKKFTLPSFSSPVSKFVSTKKLLKINKRF